MNLNSKRNATFAGKTGEEYPLCEFINLCYRIVLLTQIERYNKTSEDSDTERITLDI